MPTIMTVRIAAKNSNSYPMRKIPASTQVMVEPIEMTAKRGTSKFRVTRTRTKYEATMATAMFWNAESAMPNMADIHQ